MTAILLAGNHSCGNRGDAAILRGLLAELETLVPDATIDVTSRFPTSSAYLLGRHVQPDAMTGWPADAGRVGHRRWFSDRLVPLLLAWAARRPSRLRIALLPAAVRKRIDALRSYDTVIQVGGSFFVDLYGPRQYDTPHAALCAGRPLLLLGHSMGPFEGTMSAILAPVLLRGARIVSLRERTSHDLLETAGLPLARVRGGADTAWLVPRARTPSENEAAVERLLSSPRPCVALTVRDLAPFDRRLGVTQAAYEVALAALIDRLVAAGHDVLIASMCTGIEQYRDDRIPALRVRQRVARPEHVRVVMDELNDLDLGRLFAGCRLLIGTRLHSAIVAMNFGTPALAINYEHKSRGILDQLGLSDLSFSVQDLLDGRLAEAAERHLEQLTPLKARVEAAVTRERGRAATMVREALEATGILPTHSLTSGPDAEPPYLPATGTDGR